MSIQERIDLVGNVSAQARAWARDIDKLTAATKRLNRAQGGGGGGGASARSARAARSPSSSAVRAARMPAAKQYGPGRREAGASAVQRHREETRAARQSATAQARAARQQSQAQQRAAKQQATSDKRAAKESAVAQAKADKARAKDPRIGGNAKPGRNGALPRQEVGGIGGMVNSAIGNFAADAMSAAVSAIASLMKSIGSTFVAAQLFREQSLAGLTILQKSGSEAKKTWDESYKLARDTGSTQQETMTAVQSMMSSGFKKNDAVEMYKLMTAMSVVNPSANLEGIARAIGQIKNTGRLQGDELMQLADAGVNVDEIYNQLGKKLGKTRAEIMKLQEAGKISSTDAIDAIKAAMKVSVGGDPEAVLKKRANSMTAILARLQAAPFTFFSGLEANPALGDKMKESLRGLVDMLDPGTEKGARFAASVSNLISIMSGPALDAFSQVVTKTGETIDKFNEASAAATKFSSALDGFKSKTGIDVPKSLGISSDGFFDFILGPLYSLPRKISEVFGQMGSDVSFSDAFAFVTTGILGMGEQAIEAARSVMSSVFEAMGGAALESMSSVQSMMMESVSSLFTGMDWGSVGMNAMAGLAAGILGGMSGVIGAAISVASAAISAAESALSINSPSKEFAALGHQIPAGLAKGTVDNMGVVTKASQAMAGTATTATQKSLPFVGSAMRDMGLGGGNVTNNNMGGMRLNAPIMMSGGDATPQGVQMQLESLIQRGVQNFMNASAVAA